MIWAIVALGAGALLTGCVDVVHVYDRDGGRTDGVPFFPKVTKWKQTTAYVDRWTDLTLKKIEVDAGSTTETTPKPADVAKPQEIENWTITRHAHASDEADAKKLDDLINAIRASDGAAIETKFFEFTKTPRPDIALAKGEPFSNVVTTVLVPDYDRQMYVDAPLPWFGSSNFSASIAADGTLSSTTADVSTGLTDALDKLTPTKDLLSAVAKPLIAAVPKILGASAPKAKYRYVLTITEWAYQFEVVRAFGAERDRWTPLLLAADSAYTVTDPRGGAEPKDDKDVTKIKFDGTVGIPK